MEGGVYLVDVEPSSESVDGSVDYTDGVSTDSHESNPPNSATDADDNYARSSCLWRRSQPDLGAGDIVSMHSPKPVDTQSAQAVSYLDVKQDANSTGATQSSGKK